MGRMNGKCLVFGVPGSGRLKSTNIRTVAKLCLSIATNDGIVLGLGEPLLLLLWSALLGKCNLI
jgi:hypothetical protein